MWHALARVPEVPNLESAVRSALTEMLSQGRNGQQPIAVDAREACGATERDTSRRLERAQQPGNRARAAV